MQPTAPPPIHPGPLNEIARLPPQTPGRGPSHPWHSENTCQRHPTHPAQTATSTTPSRRPSSHPKRPRILAPTSNSPSAKPTKRTTDASRYHQSAGSCWHTQLRAIQPTSHPPVRMSAMLSEFALATSVLINSTASYARVEGDVDQRHSALARCLADLVTTHTGAKTIPGLPREPQPGAESEGARVDVVFNLRGHTFCIDTAVVTPFSSNAGLISAASARTGCMVERQEKKQFDRYPRINLVPLSLEITGGSGYHAQTFIKQFCSDTDHPLTSIRDGWAGIQTTSHNSVCKQPLQAVST